MSASHEEEYSDGFDIRQNSDTNVTYAEKEAPDEVVRLPDSIYSTVMYSFIWDVDKVDRISLPNHVVYVLAHFLCLFLQLTFVYYIWEEYDAQVRAQEACVAESLVLFCAIAVNVAECLNELWETVQYVRFVVNFSGDANAKQYMTSVAKGACVVIICLPKFVIGLLVLIVGSGFIAVSETNTDVIMNMVAVTFVVQLDELFGRTLMPDYLVEEIQSTLQLPVKAHKFFVFMRDFKPLAILVAIIGTVVGFHFALCEVTTGNADSPPV